MPGQLRIFVSSAGEAAAERQRAQLVIESLAKRYARLLAIDPVACEAEPTPASGSAEGWPGLLRPGDVVVLIMSPPPGMARRDAAGMRGSSDRAGGRVPVMGADASFEGPADRQSAGPDVLAYRRRATAAASRDDDAEFGRQEWDELAAFWSRRSLIDIGEFGATDIGDFADADGFAAKLDGDLRKLIEARIAGTASERAVRTGAVVGLTLGWAVGLIYVFVGTPDPLGFKMPNEQTPIDAVLLAAPVAGAALGAGVGWLGRRSDRLAKLAALRDIVLATSVNQKGRNWKRWGWKIGTVTGLLVATQYMRSHSLHGIYLGSIALVFELIVPAFAFLGAGIGWLVMNSAALDVPDTRE
jgi:hypothetical protein